MVFCCVEGGNWDMSISWLLYGESDFYFVEYYYYKSLKERSR